MGKDIENKLGGQPIFNQIIELLQGAKFDLLLNKYEGDKYYRQFPSSIQLVSMLFGV